jgi:ADP-heptose:LPS heptosyltransferase
MRILFSRGSLIGDIVMCLPALSILHKKTDCEITFPIAKKCKQAARLFENHPLIKEIYITNGHEHLDHIDEQYLYGKNFNYIFNPFPNHPREQDWYNYRTCCEETLLMASADLYNEYLKLDMCDESKFPKLYPFERIEKFESTIAIWPFAGYGKDLNRGPTSKWWADAIGKIIDKNLESCSIFHFGAENEPILSNDPKYFKFTNESFVKQISMSLGCDIIIGTDSGSMWCTAAYGIVPQINLITNWLPNHHSNKLALAPIGKKCKNLYADFGCSNIRIEDLLVAMESVK